jgi:uncharacterized protein (TIGR03083 family)
VVDDDAVWAAVDAERSSLADLFAGLPDEAWGVASLCEGWTVRHVLAHLALAQPTPAWTVVNVVRARLDFNRMVRDTALREASRPTAELVDVLRGMVGSRRKAPGISCREPLIDALVHGQDVAIPLGVDRVMPTDAAAEALRRVMTAPLLMAPAFPARGAYRRVRLVASDADLEIGRGPRVEATAQELLLAVMGRRSLLPV